MNVTKLDNEDFSKPLVNKVAQSSLTTFNLETLRPTQEILELDIKDFLYQGLLLKEKEFRDAVKEYDWSKFEGKIAAIYCSTDALLQQWAFMLLTTAIQPYTPAIYFGTKDEVIQEIMIEKIRNLDATPYQDKPVIIKGCSKHKVSDKAYLEVTKRLTPHVKRLMFGEACSTVPIYKQKK